MENKPSPSGYMIGACVLILAALGVYFLAPSWQKADPQPAPTPQTAAITKHYENAEYGIAFDHPLGYVLDARERGDGHREHYAIVLIREEDSELRINSEGPTAITIDLYQNNLDNQTLLGWFNGNNVSNFKLSDGTYSSTTIDGREAITYRWSGLYEGVTTAFLHNERIVAVSVTWLTPEDENIDTYKTILSSLRLSEKRI
jgi:hypothetical protein